MRSVRRLTIAASLLAILTFVGTWRELRSPPQPADATPIADRSPPEAPAASPTTRLPPDAETPATAEASVPIAELPAPALPPPPHDFVPNGLLANREFREKLLADIRVRRRGEIADFHKGWLEGMGLPDPRREILVEQLLDYEMRHAEKMMPISKGGAFPKPPPLAELAEDRRQFIARLLHLFGEAAAASYEANFPGPGSLPPPPR